MHDADVRVLRRGERREHVEERARSAGFVSWVKSSSNWSMASRPSCAEARQPTRARRGSARSSSARGAVDAGVEPGELVRELIERSGPGLNNSTGQCWLPGNAPRRDGGNEPGAQQRRLPAPRRPADRRACATTAAARRARRPTLRARRRTRRPRAGTRESLVRTRGARRRGAEPEPRSARVAASSAVERGRLPLGHRREASLGLGGEPAREELVARPAGTVASCALEVGRPRRRLRR